MKRCNYKDLFCVTKYSVKVCISISLLARIQILCSGHNVQIFYVFYVYTYVHTCCTVFYVSLWKDIKIVDKLFLCVASVYWVFHLAQKVEHILKILKIEQTFLRSPITRGNCLQVLKQLITSEFVKTLIPPKDPCFSIFL